MRRRAPSDFSWSSRKISTAKSRTLRQLKWRLAEREHRTAAKVGDRGLAHPHGAFRHFAGARATERPTRACQGETPTLATRSASGNIAGDPTYSGRRAA